MSTQPQKQTQLKNFPSNPGAKAGQKGNDRKTADASAERKQDQAQGRPGGMRSEGESCNTSDASEQSCN